jgi:hypothetical protein
MNSFVKYFYVFSLQEKYQKKNEKHTFWPFSCTIHIFKFFLYKLRDLKEAYREQNMISFFLSLEECCIVFLILIFLIMSLIPSLPSPSHYYLPLFIPILPHLSQWLILFFPSELFWKHNQSEIKLVFKTLLPLFLQSRSLLLLFFFFNISQRNSFVVCWWTFHWLLRALTKFIKT